MSEKLYLGMHLSSLCSLLFNSALSFANPLLSNTVSRPAVPQDSPGVHKLAQSFIQLYLRYLQILGATTLNIRPSSSSSHITPVSQREQTEDKRYSQLLTATESIHSVGNAYMYKVVGEEGLLLVCLSLKGPHIACDLYSMHLPPLSSDSRPSSDSRDKDKDEDMERGRRREGLLVRECSRVKHQLHLGSWVYDYHVEKLQAWLGEEEANNFSMGGAEWLSTLDNLVTEIPIAPSHARNSVTSRLLSFPLPHTELSPSRSAPAELFHFICRHPSRYGLHTLESRSIHPAFYFTSTSPLLPLSPVNDQGSHDLYSIVAFVLQETWTPGKTMVAFSSLTVAYCR